MKIRMIQAREILDSRGNPTVEATVILEDGIEGTASVPSGASTGRYEARELRDNATRYHGLGVQRALAIIEQKITPRLKGRDCRKQDEIDQVMVALDGTEQKSKLGANAILAVSLANARAAAAAQKIPLYQLIHSLYGGKIRMPKPCFNIINGGRHADNNVSIQEFMIVPQLKSSAENIRAASEIYHQLKQEIHQKYGQGNTNVGDEGGFAPEKLRNSEEALLLIMKAIQDCGYGGKVKLALDAAASEFYDSKEQRYTIDGKKMKTAELQAYYLHLTKKYPIFSIEDPFQQDDFQAFAKLNRKIQVVGDDLTVTNIKRIKKAIHERSCRCLLLKVNQIGTLTEALQAATLAHNAGWKIMVSHRSGETEDTFIADVAVGIGAEYIKAGAPCRGERTAKYNRLLRIAEVIPKQRKSF